MSEDLDYKLDGMGEELPSTEKDSNKKIIIIIIILGTLLLCALTAIIILSIKLKDKDSDDDNQKKYDDNKKKNDEELITYINVTYFNDKNEIENTFKDGGKHYDVSFGNVNQGKDYIKSDLNSYNLYIPKSAMNKKDKYNKIILWLHPGAWIGLNKEMLIPICESFSKSFGYISATVGYTKLLEKSTEHKSIFRIIDEITASINHMKNKLKNEGFDDNKLELVIGGLSAGGHLSLLYGYFMKESSIPIKFLINIAGPATPQPDYYLENKIFNDTLENLEPATVKEAKIKEKLKQVKNDIINPVNMTKIMNYFLGRKYSDEEMEELFDGDNVKTDEPRYKELSELVNLAGSPLTYIKIDSPPTINYYGGNDADVGVEQYSLLKTKYYEVGYNKDVIIYARYNDHPNILDYSTENGKEAFNDFFHTYLPLFEKKYLHNEN